MLIDLIIRPRQLSWIYRVRTCTSVEAPSFAQPCTLRACPAQAQPTSRQGLAARRTDPRRPTEGHERNREPDLRRQGTRGQRHVREARVDGLHHHPCAAAGQCTPESDIEALGGAVAWGPDAVAGARPAPSRHSTPANQLGHNCEVEPHALQRHGAPVTVPRGWGVGGARVRVLSVFRRRLVSP